jgi:hypothetical protein
MDGRSAAGLDGVGAAFVKNAFFTTDNRPNDRVHIILPLLASICHKAYNLQAIPRQWQTSRIRPLFKKGEDTNPANYRLLAISSVFYRLYANSLREITTRWVIKNNGDNGSVLPDTQFAFSLET